MTTGEKIKELISEHDTKETAVAKEIHISSSTLSNYVTDSSRIPGEVAARLAVYFNVTTDYLLGLTDQAAVPFRLSPSERLMISDFRTLTAEQRELVVQNIAFMKAQNERG